MAPLWSSRQLANTRRGLISAKCVETSVPRGRRVGGEGIGTHPPPHPRGVRGKSRFPRTCFRAGELLEYRGRVDKRERHPDLPPTSSDLSHGRRGPHPIARPEPNPAYLLASTGGILATMGVRKL